MQKQLYFCNFQRTLEMSLINCEINLILTWPANFVILEGYKVTTFAKTDAKLYVPGVTLSTQDCSKLLHQLKLGFKCTIDWNKYQSKVTTENQNEYLYYLIYPSFQGVNRSFISSLKNNADRTGHTEYFLPKVEIKDYNVLIDEQNLFDQPVKNDLRTYDNI